MPNFFSRRREPFAFMLTLGIIGSALLFFFILIVFLAKEAGHRHAIPVPLPAAFALSTVLILGSSLTLFSSKKAFYNEKFEAYRRFILATFVLGTGFLGLQLWGWQVLFSTGITMANDTGGSFVYILSGLHLLHTLGGVVALTFAVKDAFANSNYIDSYIYSVNPPNQLRLKLISMYWHFVDVLWVILFVFLRLHAA